MKQDNSPQRRSFEDGEIEIEDITASLSSKNNLIPRK